MQFLSEYGSSTGYLNENGFGLGFGAKGSWKQFVIGIGIGACTIILSCVLVWLLGGVQIKSVQIDIYLLVAILYTIPKWMMVAVVEEGLIRGYVQGVMKESFGPNVSIFFPSLLFASIHLFNIGSTESLLPMICLFLDGLFFVFCYR
ncbi:CPBP family intramembrane glutamic endopeptidase [Brevibacillus daliensis]|uniref:CPBP family intramembrane glutamic endopeptidase n=1 Tax=Brevibacillus daliensis TaxID=2892995 RepID=UPI001E5C2DEF|nr:CPBP family intramembrane glutamic endopeptidase [Brevibacillus daliensis]